MKNSLIVTILFLTSNLVCGQNPGELTLGLTDFIQKVKQHHPVAKIASIQVDKANANLLSAKGAFDPSIQYVNDRKTFEAKNYYYYNETSLRLPLPIGDIKTGLESNGGSFITDETTTGNSSYAGVEIPLARGLLLDKRRATLQQARIGVKLGDAERMVIINDLLLDAIIAYYQWSAANAMFDIYDRYALISYQRLQAVKTQFANGDVAQMDTLEAFAQYQSFEQMKLDASVNRTSAVYEINNYLWDDAEQPQALFAAVKPQNDWDKMTMNWQTLPSLLSSLMETNPLLQQYNFKLDGLNIERRLKFQDLLPVVNVRANLLNRGYNVLKGADAVFLQNNYKWGLEVKIPLRLREARGAYRLSRLKIDETELAFQQKTLVVQNKLSDYYNQAMLYQQQQNLLRANVDNYASLLSSEIIRFQNGESSIFLINSRENKLIDALQKSVEVSLKLRKAYYSLYWVLGDLDQAL